MIERLPASPVHLTQRSARAFLLHCVRCPKRVKREIGASQACQAGFDYSGAAPATVSE